jgi:hypothetical protein
MSALELVGPLICLAALPQYVAKRNVIIHVDNIGSVTIWQKGYSNRCDICNTIVTAMADICATFGTTLYLHKSPDAQQPVPT